MIIAKQCFRLILPMQSRQSNFHYLAYFLLYLKLLSSPNFMYKYFYLKNRRPRQHQKQNFISFQAPEHMLQINSLL